MRYIGGRKRSRCALVAQKLNTETHNSVSLLHSAQTDHGPAESQQLKRFKVFSGFPHANPNFQFARQTRWAKVPSLGPFMDRMSGVITVETASKQTI